jgi:hypothetical protein
VRLGTGTCPTRVRGSTNSRTRGLNRLQQVPCTRAGGRTSPIRPRTKRFGRCASDNARCSRARGWTASVDRCRTEASARPTDVLVQVKACGIVPNHWMPLALSSRQDPKCTASKWERASTLIPPATAGAATLAERGSTPCRYYALNAVGLRRPRPRAYSMIRKRGVMTHAKDAARQ